jgi:hypothetical protein
MPLLASIGANPSADRTYAETVPKGLNRALDPGEKLVFNDFIGPIRFT